MLIECKDVCLAYENHTVLSNLSFPVRKGDYLCIIGENGSGKTTLMRALLGLKSVEKGSIVMGDGLKQNEIGYLPQQTGLQKDFLPPYGKWCFPAESTGLASGRFFQRRINGLQIGIWNGWELRR